jgi:hypothetical protein
VILEASSRAHVFEAGTVSAEIDTKAKRTMATILEALFSITSVIEPFMGGQGQNGQC